MAFKQPRVPEYRENEEPVKHLKALTLFLKDFCQEVWTASRLTDKGLAGIKYPVTSVNKKTGDVVLTAGDVGARANTWLPSASDIKKMTRGTWNGNTGAAGIPDGLSYVTAGPATDGHGFPASYVTVFAVKDNVNRTFQILIEKTNGKMWVRSATDGTVWGDWRRYLFVDEIYPVGAIYISARSTSPASLFGGTWEQLKDRFLLAAGGSYAAASTGGAATVTLTTEQIPSHTHYIREGTTNSSMSGYRFSATNGNFSMAGYNGYAGGGAAHDNMPPYLAVYMWKRVS